MELLLLLLFLILLTVYQLSNRFNLDILVEGDVKIQFLDYDSMSGVSSEKENDRFLILFELNSLSTLFSD